MLRHVWRWSDSILTTPHTQTPQKLLRKENEVLPSASLLRNDLKLPSAMHGGQQRAPKPSRRLVLFLGTTVLVVLTPFFYSFNFHHPG